MPTPVAPMKITCQSCGWSTVIPQQGDVLFTQKQCERCGSEKLTQSLTGTLDIFNPASFVLDILKK